jgi:hypothetical protein
MIVHSTDQRPGMMHGQAEPLTLPERQERRWPSVAASRYFAAVADAGSFTHAAGNLRPADPEPAIRRLEEIVGTPLLQRRREGCAHPNGAARWTPPHVLSLVDHEVNRTRQAAGLGQPCLGVLPPRLPDAAGPGRRRAESRGRRRGRGPV